MVCDLGLPKSVLGANVITDTDGCPVVQGRQALRWAGDKDRAVSSPLEDAKFCRGLVSIASWILFLGTVRCGILGKHRENSMPGTLVVHNLQVDAGIPNDRESFRVLPGMRSNMKTSWAWLPLHVCHVTGGRRVKLKSWHLNVSSQ